MTALKKYARLECPGLWRERPEAQRREVVVSFGEASIVLSDSRTEVPLSHWSLPALERLNPGEVPALYSPGSDQLESLEIDDTSMIDAIETVRGTIAARMAQPGRLRGALLVGTMVVLGLLAVFWLPGAMVDHTAAVAPPSIRAEVGRMALADLGRVGGEPCTGTLGQRALNRLNAALGGGGELVVLREGIPRAVHLPGGIVVLNRHLIEDYDGPEVAAGYVLAERVEASRNDPLARLLHYAGLRATFGLLTTGSLNAASVKGYAEYLLTDTPPRTDPDLLVARFKSAGLATSAYAKTLDSPNREALIAADPFRDARPAPILTDGDWVSLQGICAQ